MTPTCKRSLQVQEPEPMDLDDYESTEEAFEKLCNINSILDAEIKRLRGLQLVLYDSGNVVSRARIGDLRNGDTVFRVEQPGDSRTIASVWCKVQKREP